MSAGGRPPTRLHRCMSAAHPGQAKRRRLAPAELDRGGLGLVDDERGKTVCGSAPFRERLSGDGFMRQPHAKVRASGSSLRPTVTLASSEHQAPDEHSAAEVSAEHRPDLGAEQRRTAEDGGAPRDQVLCVIGRLGMLHDPVRGAAVVELI